jgi:acyl-CoA thioesterase
VTEEEILARFRANENPSAETLGIQILAYDRPLSRVTLLCNAARAHCHSIHDHPKGGIVQGGFVTGWLDAAMAHACIARSEFSAGVPSLEIKVSFLLAAHPGVYHSYGWITRWGRRFAFMEAELRDDRGTIIARASSTAALTSLKKE